MEILMKSVDALKEYENNPRRNDDAVDAVAASIDNFGFKVPILIDENNVIIAGHTRLKAAKKLGLKAVPCIECSDLTPEQIRAFRLADNKVSELAEWDLEKLNFELGEIEFDMEQFGFDDDFSDEFSRDDEMEDADNIDDFFSDRESKKKEEKLDGTIYEVIVNAEGEEKLLKDFLDTNAFVYKKK